MKYIERILQANPIKDKHVKMYRNGVHFISKDYIFSVATIRKIISFINGVKGRYKTVKVPFYFELGNIIIEDKLTYVIFECICYLLISEGHSVYIFWRPEKSILTDGVFSSPLRLLSNEENTTNRNKFSDKFLFDTHFKHYRKVIRKTEDNYLGIVMDDINNFLKYQPVSDGISDGNRAQISEVIAELAGNACEHGDSDCLVDIDITDIHEKEVDGVIEDGKFIGINIALLNFSIKAFSDDLKIKCSQENLSDRYQKLVEAYEFHKSKFDSKDKNSENSGYYDVDFWNVACLQDKISGRIDEKYSGGTGTTILIRSFQEQSDTDNCYITSGKRVVYFKKEYLSYDESHWIGFNQKNDFFSDIPDDEVIGKCPLDFPGTGFNLNFVIKMEE